MADTKVKLIDTTPGDVWENLKTFYSSITGGEVLEVTSKIGIMASILQYIRSASITDINMVSRQNFINQAEGASLDLLGLEYATPRNEGDAAITDLLFTFTGALPKSIYIPQGTRVLSTVDGAAVFTTDTDTTLATGAESVTIAATCTATGTDGNGYNPGDISNLATPLPFVASVENTTTTQGGAAIESDERYRARLLLSWNRPSTAGTQKSVKYWAYTHNNSIIDVAVPHGGTFSTPPGEIWVYPLLTDGEITDTTFNAALEAFLNTEEVKPTCITLLVKSVTGVSYSFKANIEVMEGYSLATKETELNTAIDAFILSVKMKLGHDFIVSQLNNVVMSVEGIKNFNLVYWWSLDNTTVDIVAAENERLNCTGYTLVLSTATEI